MQVQFSGYYNIFCIILGKERKQWNQVKYVWSNPTVVGLEVDALVLRNFLKQKSKPNDSPKLHGFFGL